MGLVYGCTVSNSVKFFPDKRGLISGLVVAGYGLGAVIAAPLAQRIIDSADVLVAFRTLGAIYFIVIIVGSFFIATAPAEHKPQNSNENTDTAKGSDAAVANIDKSWRQMLVDKKYYLLLLLMATGVIPGLIIISQASSMAQEIISFNSAKAALIVSTVAICNTLGRVVCGWISDKIGRHRVMPVMYIISSLMVFLLTAAGVGRETLFIAAVIIIGFCFGGFMGLFPALTIETFGSKNSGTNWGFMFIGFAFASFVGPMLASWCKTLNNGDYGLAFVVAACISLLGAIVMLLANKFSWLAVHKARESKI
jgi:MFS family permease